MTTKFKSCGRCDGRGTRNMTKRIGSTGLFGWREPCERCEGRGYVAYDTWTRPTLIGIAIVAAYFIWQVFFR